MSTRVRDHIRIHKLVTAHRGRRALLLVAATVGLLLIFGGMPSGSGDAVLGTYNPFTDEITLHEDRIQDASLSLEHVQVHERFHQWQYQNIPYLLDVTLIAGGAMFAFFLFGVLTLDGVWLKLAGLAFLASESTVEIPAYMATMVRTGEPAGMVIWYAAIPLILIWTGYYTDLFAAYVTREPDRAPSSWTGMDAERWYREDVARQKRRRRWGC